MAKIQRMTHKTVVAEFTMEEWNCVKAALRDAAIFADNSGCHVYAKECRDLRTSVSPGTPPNPNPLNRKSQK